MKTRSRTRSALYADATLVVAFAVLEVGASWLMLISYRANHVQNFENEDPSYLSTVNLARRLARQVGFGEPTFTREETQPSPFLRADALLGYDAAPGSYTHTYSRRNGSPARWEHYRNKARAGPARRGRASRPSISSATAGCSAPACPTS